MRRILTLALLLLFTWPLIAPAFAATGEAALPICCRRAGAHHCTGMSDAPGEGLSLRPPRCPAYPAATTSWQLSGLRVRPAALLFAELLSQLSVSKQPEARARVALDRSRHKRGPPTA